MRFCLSVIQKPKSDSLKNAHADLRIGSDPLLLPHARALIKNCKRFCPPRGEGGASPPCVCRPFRQSSRAPAFTHAAQRRRSAIPDTSIANAPRCLGAIPIRVRPNRIVRQPPAPRAQARAPGVPTAPFHRRMRPTAAARCRCIAPRTQTLRRRTHNARHATHLRRKLQLRPQNMNFLRLFAQAHAFPTSICLRYRIRYIGRRLSARATKRRSTSRPAPAARLSARAPPSSFRHARRLLFPKTRGARFRRPISGAKPPKIHQIRAQSRSSQHSARAASRQ